jgi:assimilatory nitrate reductase electron transfer subunit
MRRVVIAGYGMAGARLADEIRALDTALEITIVGAERHPAYNRVLLSSVVAGNLPVSGVLLHDDRWADRNRIDLRTGVSVTSIDEWLTLSDESIVDFDLLVLATGSNPVLPPVPGLAGAGDVVAFRGLDDCARIVAAERVVVLGGGLLGLEAARGLAGRGVPVTVVHAAEYLMERQLDPGAGAALSGALAKRGIDFRIGRTAVRHLPGEGLLLDDGDLVPADLVVVAAGTRPETGLAEAAGITVAGGVVVDDCLRTSDPRVCAIGDCATHPGTAPGLVRPAWEQAEVLAKLITGADPAARYRGTKTVTRLKASGIDLASMGEAHTEAGASGAEVVRLDDPARDRYAKLVLRDDVVTGAIVLGFPDAAAAISQLHDSGATVPEDRISLLLGRAAKPIGPVVTDVICECNSVPRSRLVQAWRSGARTAEDFTRMTRAGTGCGGCAADLLALAEALGDEAEDARFSEEQEKVEHHATH